MVSRQNSEGRDGYIPAPLRPFLATLLKFLHVVCVSFECLDKVDDGFVCARVESGRERPCSHVA